MVAVERELPVVGAPPSADAIPLALRRRGGTPRQVLAVVLVGTIVLALFASRDLSSWLSRIGDDPPTVALQRAAAAWDGAMAQIDLSVPSAWLRQEINRLRDIEWPAMQD